MSKERAIELLRELAEAEVAETRDMRPALRRALQQRATQTATTSGSAAPPLARWRLGLRVVVLATVLALGLVGIRQKLSEPEKVSAAEILSRANQVAGDAGAFGLTVLHGVKEWSDPDGSVYAREELWYQAPDKLHWVQAFSAPDFPHNTYHAISNGDTVWTWNTEQGDIVFARESRGEYAVIQSGWETTNGWYQEDQQLSMERIMAEATKHFDVRVLGEERLVERETWVLELRAKPDSLKMNITGPGIYFADTPTMRFWFDKELYVALRVEYVNPEGKVKSTVKYTTFDTSPGALDGATFEPPADMPIKEAYLWARPAQWQRAAERARYTIFQPAYMPEGYKNAPLTDVPDTSVLSSYFLQVERPDGGREYIQKLEFFQRAKKGKQSVADMPGEDISVGGLPAKLRQITVDGQEQIKLSFEREGTSITLTAFAPFEQAELIKIAESLGPVAK